MVAAATTEEEQEEEEMQMVNRRQFGLLLGSSTTVLAAGRRLAAPAHAQAKPKVVVIGGGPGGATAAKYIAKDGGGAIEVTLVEPTKQFTTCFHSNLYLGGFKPLEAITHTYDKLASAYGIKLSHQAAAGIDRDKKQREVCATNRHSVTGGHFCPVAIDERWLSSRAVNERPFQTRLTSCK